MKSNFLIALLTVFSLGAYSQNLTLKWSDKLEYNNSKDGFFNEMIGENSSYVYGYMTNSGATVNVKKLSIMAFDKNTNKVVKHKKILGYKELAKSDKDYKDLDLYKLFVYEDFIYIFWKKNTKGKEELYVQSLDNQLNSLKKLTKVHEIKFEKKEDRSPVLFVVGNSAIKDGRIMIGTELGGNEGQNIKFLYKILNQEFNIEQTNQITLDFLKIEKSRIFSSRNKGLSSSYTLGVDGNVHMYTDFNYSYKERKKFKEEGTWESKPSSLYSKINTKTGELYSKSLKFKGKNLFSIYKTIHKKGITLHGFYSDEDKDPYGKSINGLFYAELDEQYNVKAVKFNGFTKSFMDEVFKNEADVDRYAKSGSCCLFGGGKKAKNDKATEDERLANDYQIKDIITNKNGETFLFCSREQLWSTEHCTTDPKTGARTCTTTYHNRQTNVTVFKIDDLGEMVWGKNLYRTIHYSGGPAVWSYEDLNVVAAEKGFYMIYDNAILKNEKGKKKRKKADKTYPFEYAYIDFANGNFERKFYKVNKENTPRKEIKKVRALSVSTLNGKFYVQHAKIRRKFFAYLCCFFPPVMNNPKFMFGDGYIGEIKPVE